MSEKFHVDDIGDRIRKTASKFEKEIVKMAVVVHVLSVLSRCCFVKNGKERNKEL